MQTLTATVVYSRYLGTIIAALYQKPWSLVTFVRPPFV
jgi:hypothetical protein